MTYWFCSSYYNKKINITSDQIFVIIIVGSLISQFFVFYFTLRNAAFIIETICFNHSNLHFFFTCIDKNISKVSICRTFFLLDSLNAKCYFLSNPIHSVSSLQASGRGLGWACLTALFYAAYSTFTLLQLMQKFKEEMFNKEWKVCLVPVGSIVEWHSWPLRVAVISTLLSPAQVLTQLHIRALHSSFLLALPPAHALVFSFTFSFSPLCLPREWLRSCCEWISSLQSSTYIQHVFNSVNLRVTAARLPSALAAPAFLHSTTQSTSQSESEENQLAAKNSRGRQWRRKKNKAFLVQ